MPTFNSVEILLDVSDKPPPEPLELTLEAAENLQAGQYLHMLHRRDPCLLYGNLDDNGFVYIKRDGKHKDNPSAVELFIWRENDIAAEVAVKNSLETV